MDLITKAMKQKYHLCEDKNLIEQTWEQFYQNATEKKVFLFGIGGGMAYFFRYCCGQIKIEGVIDNDEKKQNQRLGWFSAEVLQTKYENFIIQSPNILNDYDERDVTVLITSTNYYNLMVKQLKQLGYKDYFVLLMMEVNRRKQFPNEVRKGFEEIREEFIVWCCKQEIADHKIVMHIGEYGGHAKSITNQLLKLEMNLDIVWLVDRDSTEIPDGVRLVSKRNWKNYIYEMETAKIWLFDINIPDHIIKRKDQIYIQTKHWSSITLKTFGLDDASTCTSDEVKEQLKRHGKKIDYIFSGSDFDEKSCQSGFGFQGKTVRVGSARSDILFDESIKTKVYSKFNLKQNTHVLLYSPTYRDKEFRANQNMTVTLDMNTLLSTLEERWGGKWVLFVRLHPWLDFKKCGLKETENIINAGKYQESEELVAASNIMITDYSSIMFEAAFLKRPVFLYAPDRKEYIDGERGLLIEYDDLPFPIAETNTDLKQSILNFDVSQYEKNVTDFLDKYGIYEDGHAGERAAKFIAGFFRKNL